MEGKGWLQKLLLSSTNTYLSVACRHGRILGLKFTTKCEQLLPIGRPKRQSCRFQYQHALIVDVGIRRPCSHCHVAAVWILVQLTLALNIQRKPVEMLLQFAVHYIPVCTSQEARNCVRPSGSTLTIPAWNPCSSRQEDCTHIWPHDPSVSGKAWWSAAKGLGTSVQETQTFESKWQQVCLRPGQKRGAKQRRDRK